jgi:hypothetical protein
MYSRKAIRNDNIVLRLTNLARCPYKQILVHLSVHHSHNKYNSSSQKEVSQLNAIWESNIQSIGTYSSGPFTNELDSNNKKQTEGVIELELININIALYQEMTINYHKYVIFFVRFMKDNLIYTDKQTVRQRYQIPLEE